MQPILDAMRRHAATDPAAVAMSEPGRSLTRRDLLDRVTRLASALRGAPSVVGLLGPNGIDLATAQLACAVAGRTVVPLPGFFSRAQLAHVVRDAGVSLILATEESMSRAMGLGLPAVAIGQLSPRETGCEPAGGFAQIIYTSGSTGDPKGVKHEGGQIAWSSAALAAATGAGEGDSYLSVLPLPMLLETICAVFVPVLVGARVHFEPELAEAIGDGSVSGLADAFRIHRPSMSVLVPQLLRALVLEIAQTGGSVPDSLRFVAVGGAPVPGPLAEAAWRLGIPVHEGYGLSECCSVVAVNRPGERRPGTSGRPLDGLSVTIDEGEIVVSGPSVMAGYLGGPAVSGAWRTGDLGVIDEDGYLAVHGRRDNLIVTSYGRNVSPEWIETMLLGDARIAACAVAGSGAPHLTALLVPSRDGAAWFSRATAGEIARLVEAACADAPGYAVPKAHLVVPMERAACEGLFAGDGRIRRGRVQAFVAREQAMAAVSLL